MNVVIKHDNVDISNSAIVYDREHDICTGVASLEMEVPLSINRTFHPWDIIEVWENGNKKAKFYITNVDKGAKDGKIKLSCDDESKKLTDYFITETYTIDYLSYSKTWITKFLDEAKISYTFTVDGDGVPLSNNTSLGFDSAFSIITTLLQQSGWYIYFDPNGTAIIGDLNKDVSNPDHTINASDFSEFQRELDDDRLRNRAVVWGNTNPTYGEVFVDISVQTPWNYDAQDKRAVVISNSAIYSHDQALALAQKLLNEFTQIKDEKFLLVDNDYNMKLGEIIKVNSKFWSGRGLITRINALMSEDGLVYGITLDQKCPRMFTFYSTLPPTVSGFYVYTGHLSDGVWRKHTQGSTWYDNSAGLENTYVKDLFIRNGTFATVLDDGYLYTKTVENATWNKYNHGSLKDVAGNAYTEEQIQAIACSINFSDNVVAGYNYVISGIPASGIPASGLSWILELTGGQSLIKAEQVVISGGAGTDNNKYSIVDLESTGEYNIISVSGYAPASGYITEAIDEYNRSGAGYRTMQFGLTSSESNIIPGIGPDSDSLSLGWGYGHFDMTSITGPSSSWKSSKYICDEDSTTYWYIGWDGFLAKLDAKAKTVTKYTFTQPTEWTTISPVNYRWTGHLNHKTTNTFDLVIILNPTLNNWELYHYSYTLGAGSLTQLAHKTFSAIVSSGGFTGNDYVFHTLSGDEVQARVYNLTSTILTTTTYFKATNYSNNYTGSMFMGSSGDGIIVGSVFHLGYDYETFPNCPLLPATVPKELRIVVAGYKVAKNGSTTTLGPTILYTFTSFDLPAGTDYWDIGAIGSYPRVLEVTTNTNLRRMYTIGGNTLVARSCDLTTFKYAAFTLGINLPSLSPYYFKWSDGGPWWDKADRYTPTNSSELVGKTGDTTFDFNYSLIGLSGKYAGPYFYSYNNPFELRGCPAYGTAFWSSSTPPAISLSATQLLDDLTGQISPTASTTFPVEMVIPYNLQYVSSTYGVTGSSSGKWHFSQKYLIRDYGNRWRIYFPTESTAIDDFPMGSILKHTSTPELNGKILASEESLEQTMGIFEVIKTTQIPCKVDIAHGIPTVIYDIPLQEDSDSQEFWASTINEIDSFYTHTDSKPVYEARTFNLLKPDAFPTVSGTFTAEDYERYIGISNREGILASEYTLDTPWVNMVTVASGVAVSGLITHFETSNYVPEGTYFFYTVSGVKSFFQKNPELGYWQDFSAGLPDSAVTIIRCDDLI